MKPVFDDLTYERDGFTITVSGVPMSVCTSCGERYVPGPIAVQLSEVVAGVAKRIEEEAAAHPIARPKHVEYEAARVMAGALAFA